jgi:anti-sigma factor RsiW
MRKPEDLSCKELIELVTDYLEGALPPDDRTLFEGHLAICDGCQAYLEQMRETIRLTGKLTDAALPEAAKQRLLDAFRTWKKKG